MRNHTFRITTTDRDVPVTGHQSPYCGTLNQMNDFPQRAVASPQIEKVVAQVGGIILGKERQIRLAIACLLARGHLLIEDIPGVGKTMLAHALATSLGLAFPAHPVHQRPAARRHHRRLHLQPGHRRLPVPRRSDLQPGRAGRRGQPRDAQGAKRAARGDGGAPGDDGGRDAASARAVLRDRDAESLVPGRHVPAAGVAARPLPDAHPPGLPRRRGGARAAAGGGPARPARGAQARAWRRRNWSDLQHRAQQIHASSALLDYVQALVDHTRRAADYVNGLSPRAALALLHAARAWALMAGRGHVVPGGRAGGAARRGRPPPGSHRGSHPGQRRRRRGPPDQAGRHSVNT